MSAPSGQAPVGAGAKDAKTKPRSGRETARSAALVILAVLIVAFAVANLGQVQVDWIVGSGRAPLIVVIAISLLVGILLMHFAGRYTRRRR